MLSIAVTAAEAGFRAAGNDAQVTATGHIATSLGSPWANFAHEMAMEVNIWWAAASVDFVDWKLFTSNAATA